MRLHRTFHGQDLPTGVRIQLRDLSLGAFAVESPILFAVGTQHHFEFTGPNGRQVKIVATAKRCLRLNLPGDQPKYVAAFEFVWKTPSDRATINAFVNTLMLVRAG